MGRQLVKRNKDGSQEVKSMVVVQHSTVPESPAFSILQPSTNLNVPPSNWLRNSSRMERNIFDFTMFTGEKKEHSEFSRYFRKLLYCILSFTDAEFLLYCPN